MDENLATVTRYFRDWRFSRLTHSIDGLWELGADRLPHQHCRFVYAAESGLLFRLEEHSSENPSPCVKLIGYASPESDLITEALDYNPDGSLRLVHRYVYDDRGRMVDRLEWDGQQNRRGNVTLKWDDNDQEIEECSYFPDGSVNQLHRYQHDARGNLTVEEVYAPDDSLLGIRIMAYDAHGSIIEKEWHGPDGNLRKRWVNTYDEMGNFTSTSLYDADGTMMSKAEYKYDDLGNEISCVRTNESKPDTSLASQDEEVDASSST